MLYRSRVAVTIASQLRQRKIEILVDDDVVELRCMLDFAAGGKQPARDCRRRILPTLFKRASRASIDGGRMKIPTACELSFDLPRTCQSISSKTSIPERTRSSIQTRDVA